MEAQLFDFPKLEITNKIRLIELYHLPKTEGDTTGKNSMHFDELKVVSASKEGNTITLMDSNKSFFKLPRDTVLEHYKEQQLKEMKHEQRNNRNNSMSLAYAEKNETVISFRQSRFF